MSLNSLTKEKLNWEKTEKELREEKEQLLAETHELSIENGTQASQLEDIMELFDKYKVQTEQELVKLTAESNATLANLQKDHHARMDEVVSDLELRLDQLQTAEEQLRAKSDDYGLLSDAFYRSKKEAAEQVEHMNELQN